MSDAEIDRMARATIDEGDDFKEFIAKHGHLPADYADLGAIVDVLFEYAKAATARMDKLTQRIEELQKRPTEVRILRGEAPPSGDSNLELTRRIEELESARALDGEKIRTLQARPSYVKWAGVYSEGTVYDVGDLVTKSGLWLCTQRTGMTPGTAHGCWKLIVKQGRAS